MENNIYKNQKRNQFFTWLFVLAGITLVMFSTDTFAQGGITPAGYYTFSTDTTGDLSKDKDGNAIDMTTGTFIAYGPDVDDIQDVYLAAPIIPLGFTFNFCGTSYTDIQFGPDGQLQLGSTPAYVITLPAANTNQPALNIAKLIALRSDQKTSTTGQVVYKTQPGTGGDVFIIEYYRMRIPWNSVDDSSNYSTYQIRLYESSGIVEFVYGKMFNDLNTTHSSSVAISSSNILPHVATITNLTSTLTKIETNTTTYTTTPFPADTEMYNLMPLNVTDTTRRYFRFTPPPPCTTPTDQATTLLINQVPFVGTSLTYSFNPAISTPDGYLIVRYPSGSAVTDPVNGVAYGAGGSLGAGTILYSGVYPTTFPLTTTGLTQATTYDIYIYTVNFRCVGLPFYNTTTPLFGSQTTTGPGNPPCLTTTPTNPAPGAINAPVTQILNWTAPTTGIPLPFAYDVYADTSYAKVAGLIPSSKVATAISGLTFNPLTYLGATWAIGKKYYWTIIPINSIGKASGCTVYDFTTAKADSDTALLGGLWSENATWKDLSTPLANANVIIPAGVIVSINQAVTVNNLTINGTLQWNSTTPSATTNLLTVIGNLTIGSTGKLIGHVASTTVTSGGAHIVIGGNYINDGYAHHAAVNSELYFLGSQLGGGSGAQTLGGTGTFEGDSLSPGNYGIIRRLRFATNGLSSITTSQNLCVTDSLIHAAGNLNTNGKLRIDNGKQVYGKLLNRSATSVSVNTSGGGYTNAPVVTGTGQWSGVVKWAPSYSPGANNNGRLYIHDGRVYVSLNESGTTDANPANGPTHTLGVSAMNGTIDLLCIGSVGTIGTGWASWDNTGTSPTLGNQYFYDNRLYTCIGTGTAPTTAQIKATLPTSVDYTTPFTVGGATFIYSGLAVTVSVNHDATSGSLRTISIVQGGNLITSTTAVTINILPAHTQSTTPSPTASASVVWQQSILGPAQTVFYKGNSSTISGGIYINSTNSASQFSGVANVTTTYGGGNYNAPPLIGFGLPTGINLLTNSGAGYSIAPTAIALSGGSLVGGATSPGGTTFSWTTNRSKVVSVYVLAGGSGWRSLPTIAVNGGTFSTKAEAVFPAGCLATATANLYNESVVSFTVVDTGFGYVAAPTISVETVPVGTRAMTGPTCRIGLYNLAYNYLIPATSNQVAAESYEMPANRKINRLDLLSPGLGAKLVGNTEIFGQTTPINLAYGVLDMSGFDLKFAFKDYLGISTTSIVNCVRNGSITLTSSGGGTAGRTLAFPFDAPITLVTGTGAISSGQSATSITAKPYGAPTGTGNNYPIGTRTYKLNYSNFSGDPAGLGTASRLTLSYNSLDALPSLMDSSLLLIAEATDTFGVWTNKMAYIGAPPAMGPGGPTGSKTTPQVPILPVTSIEDLGNRYYSWVSKDTLPNIIEISPDTFCAGGGQVDTIRGEYFSNVTSVTFNGVNAVSFRVSATKDSIFAVTPSGITSGRVKVYAAGTSDSSVVYGVTSTGIFSPTVTPSNSLMCSTADSVIISLNDIGADSLVWSPILGLDTSLAGLYAIAQPLTSTAFTVSAHFNSAGCIVTKVFNVGVIESSAPSPTATPSNSCFGSSATVSLNSNLSAGSFAVSVIPYESPVVPNDSVTLDTVYAVTTAVPAGTHLPFALGGTKPDGGWAGIPIGFDFNYFGNPYSTIAASTNGLLMFGPIPGYGTGTGQLGQNALTLVNGILFPSVTNPANAIAALLTNMDFSFGTPVLRYWTAGVAPTRKFYLQYQKVQTTSTSTTQSNFNIILYETTGVVEMHILNSGSTVAKTIGLQNLTSTIGAEAPGRQNNSATITTAEAWRFIPPAPYTYLWSPAAGLDDATISTPTYTITAPGSNTYDLDITNPYTGCVIEKQVTFTVNSSPSSPTITGITSICGSGSTALFSTLPSPGNTIRWYNDSLAGAEVLPGGGIVYSTPVFSLPLINNDTVFFVTERSAFCASPRTKVTVTLTNPPELKITDTIVCRGVTSIQLNVTSNTADYDAYIWSPITNLYSDPGLTVSYAGQSLTTVYAKILPTTDSLPFVVTANNFTTLCNDKDTASIKIQPLTASISSSPPFICRSGSATLSIVASTGIKPDSSIRWQQSSDGITFADTLTAGGKTIGGITFTTPVLSYDTMYYRAIISNENGDSCHTLTYALYAQDPQVLSTVTPAATCGSDTTSLKATGSTGATLTWYNSPAFSAATLVGIADSLGTVIDTTSNFYVTASMSSCVSDTDTVVAAVTNALAFAIGDSQYVCNNTPGKMSVISPIGDYDTYTWLPLQFLFKDSACTQPYTAGFSDTTVYVKTSTPGAYIYTLTATNTSTSCVNIRRDTVKVHATTPTIFHNFSSNDTILCNPAVVKLTLKPSLAALKGGYQWQVSHDSSAWADTTDIGPNANDSTLTTMSLTRTTFFRARLLNSSGADCNLPYDVLAIYVRDTVVTATDGSRCGAGIVNLSATKAFGDTMRWYKTASSTDVLGTGTSFSPYISGKDSFYVSVSFKNTCGQPGLRKKVIANSTAPPYFSAGTPDYTSLTKQVVCNNSITKLKITDSTEANFDSVTWSPISKLYTDLACTNAYNGEHRDSVYFNPSAATDTGRFIITVNAYNSGTSCGAETKDTIIAMPAAVTVTSSNYNVCVKGRVDLALSPTTSNSPYTLFGPGSVTWQQSINNNSSWVNIPNPASLPPAATGDVDSVLKFTTDTLYDTTYYRVRIKDGQGVECYVSGETTVFANDRRVNTPIATVTRCGPGSVTLSAVSSADSLIWYDKATLGTALDTTSGSFTTNVLRDDTFYVAVLENGCIADREAIYVDTTEAPILTLNDTSQAVCNGVITTLRVTTPTANFDTYVWSPITSLYLNAAGTVPYNGQNTDTVYFRRSSLSAPLVYTCTGSATLGSCSNFAKDTIYVQPATATINASPARICSTGTSQLSLSQSSFYKPGTIQWQDSPDSLVFTNIPGEVNATYVTPNNTSTVYYRALVKNSTGGGGDTCIITPVYKLVYANPQISATVNATRCGFGSATISATASSVNSIVKWYTVPTGGSSVGTGSPFNTPAVSSQTIFYAVDSLNGCVSTPRAKDTVFVTPSPSFGITPNSTICNNVITPLTVVTNIPDFTSYVWTPIAKLYTDAGATIPYTGGSASTLYYKDSIPGNKTYTCIASNPGTGCGGVTTVVMSVQPATATISSSPDEICNSGTALLTLVPSSPYGAFSIQWQRSPDNLNTYVDIPNALTASHTTIVLDTTRYYHAQIKNTAGAVCFTTATDTVEVNIPAIDSVLDGSRCGIGKVTLYGWTESSNAISKWYSTLTSTTVLATGDTFLTPNINTTTTYFVGGTIGTCIGGRMAVTATLSPADTLILSASQSVCRNSTALLTYTSNPLSFDTHSWTPITNLYKDALATIPYNAGDNEDTVYVKTAVVGTYTFVDTASHSVSECRNRATTTVIVQPDSATITATPTNMCYGGVVRLTISPSTPYGLNSVQWQASSDNITFNDIPNADSITWNDTIGGTGTRYYRARIQDSFFNSCFITGDTDTVSIVSPTLTVDDDTICGYGSGTLSAVPGGSEIIVWYDTAFGGSPLDTGTVYTTPAVTTTTTYYAQPTLLASYSNTAVVGTGTSASTTTGNPYRTAINNVAVRTQMLVTKAELNAAGLLYPGTISSLTFTATTAFDTLHFMTVQVGLSTATALTTTYLATPMTTVFTALDYVPVVGANTHVFSSPFAWDGVSNLLIEICQTRDSVSMGTTTLQASSTTFTSSVSGAVVGACTAPTGGTTTLRPNMKFDFISNCVGGRIPVDLVVDNTLPLTVNSGMTLCDDSITALSVTSTLSNFDIYLWGPSGNIYTDAAATILYTGQNLSTVYVKSSTNGSNYFTCIGTNTVSGCSEIDTAEVIVSTVPINDLTATPDSMCLSTSALLSVNDSLFGPGPQTVPLGYLPSNATSTADEEILSVTFGSMTNVSVCGELAPGPGSLPFQYSNYTTSVPPITAFVGATYPFSVQIGTCGGNFNNHFEIFIDLNRNAVFDLPAERMYTDPFVSGPHTGSGTITIPATAIAGVTLMRIVENETSAANSPTGTYTWGETEDYLLNIQGVVPVPPTISYTWNPGGLTGYEVTVNPVATTTYIVTAYDSLTGCSSTEPITVTVLGEPAAPTSAVNSSQCGYGVPAVSVTGSGNNYDFRWFLDTLSLTPIANESDSFLINYAISTTDTLWVSEFNGLCEGGRTPVIATVGQPDSVAASATTACELNPVTLTATKFGAGNTYTYYIWTATPAAGSGIPTSDTGQVIVVTPTAFGVYTYHVIAIDTTATPDCQYSANVVVSVSESPTISVTADTTICPFLDLQLNALQTDGGGRAYQFNGTNQYIAVPQSNSINLSSVSGNSITLEAWINETASTSIAGIISHYQTSTAASYFIRANNTTPFTGLDAGASTVARTAPNGTIVFGNWTHVAAVFVYNPVTANDSVFIYKNGQRLTNTTGGGVTVIPNTPDSLRIGSDFSARYFNGIIDEVRIWNVALDSTTLQNWKNRSITPSHPNYGNLAAYYDFNAVSSTTVADLSGNGNTGYLRNAPTQVASTAPLYNVTYSWSPASGLSSTTIGNPVATVTDTVTYLVTATDLNGCQVTDSVTIYTFPSPAAPTVVNGVQCGTGVPTCYVDSFQGGFITWYTQPLGGVSLPGEVDTVLQNYIIYDTDTFYVSEFDGSCSGARTQVIANVNHPDSLDLVSSEDSICAGYPITLTASRLGLTNTYDYTWSASPFNGSGLSGSDTDTVITITPFVSPALLFGNRTYTITGTDSVAGCQTQISVTVYMQPGPTAPVPTAVPSQICLGQSSQLNAGAFTSGAGVLATNNPTTNNSSSVIGFDLKNTSGVPITVHYFSFGSSATAGTVISESIWYRTSSMNCTFPTNVTTDPSWILVPGSPVNATSAGLGSAGFRTQVPLNVNVTIPPGATYAFAIGGTSVAYISGTTGCPVVGSDAFLTAYEGFGGTPTGTIANRAWTGDVTYDFLVGDPNLTYSWTPGATLNNDLIDKPIATPTATTIYTAIVNNPSTGCFATGTVTVNVTSAAGSFSLSSNPDTICNKGVTNLTVDTVTPGVTYYWQQSPTGLPGTWVNTDTGTVEVSDTLTSDTYFRFYTVCGFVGDTSGSIFIKVLKPEVTSTTAPNRCGAGPVTMTATGTGTFNWYSTSTGGTALATDTNVYTPLVIATTTYYVHAHINTCFAPARQFVTVSVLTPPLVTVTLSPNDSVCEGTSVTLSAASTNPNYTYYWSVDLVNAFDTSSSTTFNADSSDTYYLYAVDSVAGPTYGCAFLDATVITALPVPSVSPTATPTTICTPGGSTHLSANATGTSGGLLMNATFNTGADGFTVTNDGGSSFQIFQLCPPSNFTTFGIDGTPWFECNADIGGSGSTTASTLTSPAVNAAGATTLTLDWDEVYSSWTSSTPDEVVQTQVFNGSTWVTIYAPPLETSDGLYGTPVHHSVNITAYANAALRVRFVYFSNWGFYNAIDNVVINNASSAPSILWTANPADTSLTSQNTLSNPIVTPLATTIYTVVATNTNGCTSSGTVTVTYDPITPPTITSSGPTTLCQGVSDTLDAGSGYSSYTWDDGSTIIGNTQSIIVTPATSTIYTVYVSNANGCVATATQAITVNTIIPPTIDVIGSLTFCDGDSAILKADTGYASYSWYDGVSVVGTDSTYIAYTSATYIVTVTSVDGCTSTDTVVVVVNPNPPVPTLTPSGTIIICDGSGSVTLYADTSLAGPGANVFWNDFNGTTDDSLVVDYTSFDLAIGLGTYYANITVQNSFGCSSVSLDDTIKLDTCASGVTLDAKMFIEGYYTGSAFLVYGLMDYYGSGGCLYNSFVSPDPMLSDFVRISLYDPTTLALVDSVTDTLMVDGTITVNFTTAVAGAYYYIAVNHRSALETWSADSVLFSALTSYDFTTSDTMAYGNNMVDVGSPLGDPPTYAFFSGDISDVNLLGLGVGYQDGVVDGGDYGDMETAVYYIYVGYVVEDIDGGGYADGIDYGIMETNVYYIRYLLRP